METISKKINPNVKFGFGGVSAIGDKDCKYPAKKIIDHHKSSGSTSVIISRSFENYCNKKSNGDDNEFWKIFNKEIELISNHLAE